MCFGLRRVKVAITGFEIGRALKVSRLLQGQHIIAKTIIG